MSLQRPTQSQPRNDTGPSLLPITPIRQRGPRSNEEFVQLIQTLENDWTLGLKIRGKDWTPTASKRDPANEVYGHIKRLYWSAQSALHEVLEIFSTEVAAKQIQHERLELLKSLLVEKIGKKRARGAAEDIRNNSIKILRSELSSQEEPLDKAPNNESYQSYVTALQSRSRTPTDDDDEVEFSTPPSPSMEAATRRTNATPQIPDLHAEAGNPRTKRKSISSQDQRSAKASRSGSGRSRIGQPRCDIPPSKTYPSGRLFGATSSRPFESTDPSTNTSFATEVFTQPDVGGYRDDPDTADTSFASDMYEVDDVHYPNLSPSSATMGSLDDNDLIAAVAALETVEDGEESLSQPMHSLSIQNQESAGLDLYHEALLPAQVPELAPNPETLIPDQVSTSRQLTRSPKKSAIEQHQVRDLPHQGLFLDKVDTDPVEWARAPFHVRWECLRIAIELGIKPLEVMPHYESRFSEYDVFVTDVLLHLQHCPSLQSLQKPSRAMWSASESNYEGYSFSGKAGFNPTNTGPLFNLSLEPLQKLQSCRFQRAFGSDRILYLTMPSPHNVPLALNHLKGQDDNLRKRFVDWLCGTNHSLLGRIWRAFHVEEKKDKRGNPDKRTFEYRVVLFATSGIDIRSEGEACTPRYHSKQPAISIGGFLDWFMPFAENVDQKFCKAYARLDLGLSRTIPTIVFLPSQVRILDDDIRADGTHEDNSFNDTTLKWPAYIPRSEWLERFGSDSRNRPPVMNDGCSRISYGAMREIWRLQGKSGPIPSFCQARIGGAKGIWVVSAPVTSADPAHRDIWIEITPSQLKFKPHEDDKHDETYDPQRLTFEVVKFGASVVNSELHTAFIPIMLDRGVPRGVLTRLMNKRLDFEREELLQAVETPEKLRAWLNKEKSREEERQRDNDLVWQPGMPRSLSEKLVLLLESGFSPASFKYSAEQTHRFLSYCLRDIKRNLRLPIGKATNLIGIADPSGVLQPGEIHVHFSSNFIDEMTGESYSSLNSIDVLISRQPSLRRSDMQKVRAVFKPELAHLVDVVVFPTRGRFPLAGKLQGGDYDGDIFWTCWEPDLVKPFRNAPAPLDPPKPEDYDIRVEKQTLGEVLGSGLESNVLSYLRRSFEFRSNQSFLGKVKTFHEKLCYHENTIDSKGINFLADIHDLIIDAAKNGYMVSEEWYNQLVNNPKILTKKPRNPAFKEAMKDNWAKPKMGETKIKDYSQDPRKVLDYLYFNVLAPHLDDTLRIVGNLWESATTDDQELVKICEDAMVENKEEVNLLKGKLAEIHHIWVSKFVKSDNLTEKADDYNRIVERTYELYQALQPSDNAPSWWVKQQIPGNPPYWEILKASALHHFQGTHHATFAFHLAGRELCLIKAYATGTYRVVKSNMYGILKPRRTKRLLARDMVLPRSGDVSDYESASEDFDDE